MSWPSYRIVPDVAGKVPASMASSVDFPAPFGPISPVSVPFRTWNDTPSTARTPPNSRTMSPLRA